MLRDDIHNSDEAPEFDSGDQGQALLDEEMESLEHKDGENLLRED